MSGYHPIQRKAVPKHIPRPISSIDVSVELLESEVPSGKDTSGAPTIDYIQDSIVVGDDDGSLKQPSAFHIFLRILQLDTLWNGIRSLFGRGLQHEEPKQVLIKSIPITLVTIFAAHVFPMGAALGLVILNIKGFYLGGNFTGGPPSDDVKLSLLQFASKAHEVMMIASMSIIIVDFIRRELLTESGIPFGAVFGSLQFSNSSYLFSKEFMGVLKARLKRRLVKIRLVALLFVGAVLAVTVGPSSAIAIRPRLDNWPAGGTDFFLNATLSQIWPPRLDDSRIPQSCGNISITTSCISRDWMSLARDIMAYYPTMTSSNATTPFLLRLNSRLSVPVMDSRQSKGLYPTVGSVSTAPMYNLADGLAENGRFWAIAALNVIRVSSKKRNFKWRTDVTYSMKNLSQPISRSRCLPFNREYLDKAIEESAAPFPNLYASCNSSADFWGWRQLQIKEYEAFQNFVANTTMKPQIQFLDLSSVFGETIMGAIAVLPKNWPGGARLYTCTMASKWISSNMESKRNEYKVVTGHWAEWGSCANGKPIEVTKEWMQFLNPSLQDGGKTVFHSLVEAAASSPRWINPIDYFTSVIETILSTMTVTALARTASNATIQGRLKGCLGAECACGKWCLDMMPPETQEFGYGGNIYDLTGLDLSNSSKFTVHVEVNGYAYNIRGASMVLSCTVLLVYCLLVLIHIIYVLINRTTSTSFNTVSEVVVLSMQSQPTDHLHNTSAGIYTTKVFSKLVKIVRTGEGINHLELDFGDRDAGGKGDGIVEGEFYG